MEAEGVVLDASVCAAHALPLTCEVQHFTGYVMQNSGKVYYVPTYVYTVSTHLPLPCPFLSPSLLPLLHMCVCIQAYIVKLKSWLTIAPFRPDPVAESWDNSLDEREEGVRVLACAFEPDK